MDAQISKAQRTMWERMILALSVSFALHVVLAFAIQGGPSQADGLIAASITARLEPVKSNESDTPPSDPQALAAQAVEEPPAATELSPPDRATPAETPTAPKGEARAPDTTLGIPVIRDPTYYAARFLDEYPKPLSPVEARYPQHARPGNINGSVTLLLLIDEEGRLSEVSVVEAYPESMFNDAALAAFQGVRFSPARKDGRAVRSRVLITVAFESNDPSSAR